VRVLLDECLPRQLKRHFPGHQVNTVPEMGWAGIKNGPLMRLMESTVDVFVTIDGNLQYQQNLSATRLAFVVLAAPDNTVETLAPLMLQVLAALHSLQPGMLVRIEP
jgi:hypothetical protein